tara:strand:+ start:324 stop:533 length:210 start_codon:yes stop_codon:yes gene_type:complete
MKKEDRKDVIAFYETQVWLPSMPKSNTLTDEDLERLKNTLWFASWMLSVNYDKCVDAISSTMRKIFNGV